MSTTARLIILLVAIAVVQAGVLAYHKRPTPEPVAVGERIKKVNVQRNEARATLDFRRVPRCTHVVFLKPTCPLCRELAPRWAEEYSRPGRPEVLAVSFSAWDEAERYLSQHGIDVPLYATGADQAIPAAVRTRVLSVPTIAVMGEGGRVAALAQGKNYTVRGLAQRAGCPPPVRG